jgi:hypothetical protein
MSDNEAPPAKVDGRKKKREISPEQKAKLLENLKRGRETAMKNRQKKALAKKIDREEEEKARDEKIAKAVLGEDDTKTTIAELKAEIKELRAQKNSNNDEEIKMLKEQLMMVGKVVDKVIERQNQSTPKPPAPKPAEPVKLEVEEAPAPAPAPAPSAPIPIPAPAPAKKVFDATTSYRLRNLKGRF